MKYFKPSFLLFLFFLISCSTGEEKDHSYSVKEYMHQGIPDIDRPWNLDEFAGAVNILRLIKARDSLALPRYGSKRSGPLFRHMISMDNLAFLNGNLFSLHDKTFMLQNFLSIEGNLTGVYTNRTSGQQYYGTELIHLYMFALAITQKMLDLAYQINISKNRDARCMKYGLPSVQHVYENMLAFVLEKGKHHNAYGTADLEALSDTLSAAIRKNLDWFDPQTLSLLKKEMQAIAKSSPSGKVRNTYENLLKELKQQ